VALVLDTGVLLGAIDAADPAHDPCRRLVERTDEELVVPAPVLMELDYWLRRRSIAGAWASFAEDAADGAYVVYRTDPRVILAAARLQAKYTDLRVGFVDASVFLICGELGEDKVATLDRRHFSVMRTEDGRSLELLPA